jgi:hypothetical protein
MWMSMRSIIGPLMRFWYLVTVEWEQLHGLCESPA